MILIEKKPLGTIAYLGQWATPGPFTWSMIQLFQFCNEYVCSPGQYIHPEHADLSGQILMRNMIATRMQGDWLMFIDSDHNFDPDLAYRLLRLFEGYNERNEKLDVLSGMYQFKEPPHAPVAWLHDTRIDSFRQIADWDRNVQLMPVDCTGAGCVVIRRSVLEALVEKFNDLPFNPIGKYNTDDFNFFERCRQIGIKCWWAPRIECHHLCWKAITLDDYKPDLQVVPDPYKETREVPASE